MDPYPSNAIKPTTAAAAEQRPEKLEQVTTGPVIVKKAGIGKRFKSAFSGESAKTVATNVLWDVVVPGTKDVVYDAAVDWVGRTLGIDVRGVRRGGPTNYNSIGASLASKVQYNRPGFLSDPRQTQQQAQQRREPQVTRGHVSIEDIILASRVEADMVIGRMQNLTDQYGQATIADLFDLVGVTGQYTDEKFGWTSMEGARPHRQGGGYRLVLPNVVQLN